MEAVAAIPTAAMGAANGTLEQLPPSESIAECGCGTTEGVTLAAGLGSAEGQDDEGKYEEQFR